MICSPFKKKNFGFTLIELLIVIAIIAVLTTFGAASYTRIQQGSRDTQRKADLEKIRGALEQYYSDFNVYPPDKNGLISTYLNSLPTDPRGTADDYTYVPIDSAGGTNYQTYCLGVILETVATYTLSCGSSTGLNYVLTPTD